MMDWCSSCTSNVWYLINLYSLEGTHFLLFNSEQACQDFSPSFAIDEMVGTLVVELVEEIDQAWSKA